MDVEILMEDNHCLAVNKPAGMLTQGDETGVPSLVEWARQDLKFRYQKPGNVFVGLVHRLDRPVSGVVLLAKTSKAAARLSEQFRAGSVGKVYWALVEGRVGPEKAEWEDTLWKDRTTNLVRVVERGTSEGQDARLSVRVLERNRNRSLLELRPITGRSHQLRVQLASRGFPIVGDLKYGARSRLPALDGGHRIALHAGWLTCRHPTRLEDLAIFAPVPPDWPDEWRGVGS